jgi:hypothetical protein
MVKKFKVIFPRPGKLKPNQFYQEACKRSTQSLTYQGQLNSYHGTFKDELNIIFIFFKMKLPTVSNFL